MTKSEMVKKLAETWGDIPNRQAAENLDNFVAFITKTVKKDKELKIPNLSALRILKNSKPYTTSAQPRFFPLPHV